jgi:hypothetical protein
VDFVLRSMEGLRLPLSEPTFSNYIIDTDCSASHASKQLAHGCCTSYSPSCVADESGSRSYKRYLYSTLNMFRLARLETIEISSDYPYYLKYHLKGLHGVSATVKQ